MKNLGTVLIGFIVGAGMSIPGFSGGTLAILMGIYYKLLHSVDNLFKDIKGNLIFLAMFAAGGAAGFFTAARIISILLETPAAVPLRFAFLGAASAAIIPVLKDAKALPLKLHKLMLILAGIISAWLITMLPQISLSEGTVISIIVQLAGGVLLAAALVLPGISASQMLVTMGLYEQVILNVSEGNFLCLLPLAIGGAAGILLTAKLMTRLLERFNGTYLVVLGFMLFSMTELIPRTENPIQLITGIISTAAAFALTYLCISTEAKRTKEV